MNLLWEGELSIKSFLAKRNNAAVIGLTATLIYIIYSIFANLYSFDFFSYYSFDLALKELGALLLSHIYGIMLVIYFICVLCKLKNIKIIQYMLLASYLFLAPEVLLYFIFYSIAKISIIPFFYNEYNN